MRESAFGKYIRSKRIAAGLSLRDVADEMGFTHVFLGEVERGVRALLNREHWPKLIQTVPGITVADLERVASVTRPIQLDIADVPPLYQDLAMSLARRIESQDIPTADLAKLIELLKGGRDG